MRTEKQVVFLTNLFLRDNTLEVKVWDSRSDAMNLFLRDNTLEVKVWDSRSDAMRAVNGDRERIVARSVIADSGKGPYRKPPKPKKSARPRP